MTARSRILFSVALALSVPAARAAQDPLKADLVKTGLYLISGGGANSLLRLNGVGLILVDGKLPGNYGSVQAEVRKICKMSEVPLRALIVTSYQLDRNGNNAEYRSAWRSDSDAGERETPARQQ